MNGKDTFDKLLLLNSEAFLASAEYWKENFKSNPFRQENSFFLEGVASQPHLIEHRFSDELSAKILGLCKQNPFSLYVYLVASYAVVINRYYGNGTVVVGSNLFNENFNDFPQAFNSSLPLLLEIKGHMTFKEVLSVTQKAVANAAAHQHYPLQNVYEATGVDPFNATSALTIHMTTIHKHLASESQGALLTVSMTDGVCLTLSAPTDFQLTLPVFLAHLTEVVSTSIKNLEVKIDSIKFIEGTDGLLSLSAFQRNEWSAFDLVDEIEKISVNHPDKNAVEFEGARLSYRELNELVNRYAWHFVQERGLKKGEFVAVNVKRSDKLIPLVLAILKCRLVYVPIDTSFPLDRFKFILNDVKPALVIVDETEDRDVDGFTIVQLDTLANSGRLEALPPIERSEADRAYVIYTSGSTGQPKGVAISHLSLNNFFSHINREYIKGQALALSFMASPAFDISLFQMFAPLVSAGTCVVVSTEHFQNLERFIETLKKTTWIDTVPGVFSLVANYIVDQGMAKDFGHVERVFIGGDTISDVLLKRLCTVFNNAMVTVTYGATEATIFTTCLNYTKANVFDDIRGASIGLPMRGASIYVMNSLGVQCPPGIVGEIYIGGQGIGEGYIGQPELNRTKFIKNPFSTNENDRLYRTGDLGIWLENGDLQFRGRNDDQIKIRGFRVELPEIERRIKQFDHVSDAVVTTVEHGNQSKALVAYFLQKKDIQIWPSISEYLGYNDIAYFAMNNDQERVGAYQQAIERNVSGKVVLEVGTGPEAVLARHCLESGATKVYAIEILEEVYLKAKSKIESLGLSDRIILIHGNMLDVTLPELVDCCVCALVGNLGSSDGCIPIMNSARRFLKDPSQMIPSRSVVRMAATNLQCHDISYALTETGLRYMTSVFDDVGRNFDLRIALENITEKHFISTAGIFEDLDLRQYVSETSTTLVTMEVLKNGQIDGFILWLTLHTDDSIAFNILEGQKSFLPIYFPVFDQAVTVQRGDKIECNVLMKTPEGSIYPDYFLEGNILSVRGEVLSFNYASRRYPSDFKSTAFHRKVFPAGNAVSRKKLSINDMQQKLKEVLPEYMVPAVWMEIEKIPLTNNGKVDRKSLPMPDDKWLNGHHHVPPSTDFEKALADIWQELIGVEKVGIRDNFFELGGDSIISIQVVSRMKARGFEISARDIFLNETIEKIALSFRERSSVITLGEQGVLTGGSGLLPVQLEFFDRKQPSYHHFNFSIILGISKSVSVEAVAAAFIKITGHHDALRFRYTVESNVWQQHYANDPPNLVVEELQRLDPTTLKESIGVKAAYYQSQLRLDEGKVFLPVIFLTPDYEEQNRLVIVAHHLVMDGVSWRIILDDLQHLLTSKQALPRKGTSYKKWVETVERYGQSNRFLNQKQYWINMAKNIRTVFPDQVGSAVNAKTTSVAGKLSEISTRNLLYDIEPVYNLRINDLLISALVKTLNEWTHQNDITITLEGHGREDIDHTTDVSRTVGWFANSYPVCFTVKPTDSFDAIIKNTKETIRRVPDKGLGYGILKYLKKEDELRSSESEIVFNYLGQIDNVFKGSGPLTPLDENIGNNVSDDYILGMKLSINCAVRDGQFFTSWQFDSSQFSEETIRVQVENYISTLNHLLTHCTQLRESAQMKTPSDYGLPEVGVEEFETFMNEVVDGKKRVDAIEDICKLSGLQEGMLFHSLYFNNSRNYIEDFECNIRDLSVEAFRASWDFIISRHSTLRTVFYADAFLIPVQCVFKSVTMPIEILDLRDKDGDEQEQVISRHRTVNSDKLPFSFKEAPLMHITLFRLDENRHRMIWKHHHMLLDGWSLPLLYEELLSCYEGLVAGKGLPEIQMDHYGDYIRYIAVKDHYAAESFWQRYLATVTGPTLLPFIRTGADRNKGIGMYRAETVVISRTKTASISAFAQRHRVTVNTVMQGVWALLLSRYTGRKDVTFGVTVSGRPTDLKDVESRVGVYINTLPLHCLVNDDESIPTWLQRIQFDQLQCREFQYTPLRTMQSLSNAGGDLFDSLLVFENYPVDEIIALKEWKLKVSDVVIKDQINYPLTITLAMAEELSIVFSYNNSVLAESDIHRIMGHFENVVSQLIDEVSTFGAISLAAEKEKRQLLSEFNSTTADYPKNATVLDFISKQVERSPESPAIICGKLILNYRELDERSTALALHLIGEYNINGMLVPICIEKGFDLMVSILAVLKAGAAYVPIDPGYPSERIASVLSDTHAPVALTNASTASRIPGIHDKFIKVDGLGALSLNSSTTHLEPVAATSRAYVIYTSGSTGVPKGAGVNHYSMVNLNQWYCREFELNGRDKNLILSSVGFDLTQKNFFGTLMSGASIVFCEAEHFDPALILNCVRENEITLINCAPSAFYPLVDNPSSFAMLSTLRYAILGGEPITTNHLLPWIESATCSCKVVNSYGPTECTDIAAFYVLTRDDFRAERAVPLGRPNDNVQLYVLDEALRPQPIGVVGEIFIAGDGVGTGYLNDVELTAKKFLKNKFGKGNMYRTGDLGRWREDGNLEYVGRIDEQIKIRGFRIELGEIENVICRHRSVSDAVVVAVGEGEQKRIVAYVIPKSGLEKSALLAFLRTQLPDFMVPVIVEVSAFPLTPHGKVDKRNLPAVDLSVVSGSGYIAPQSVLQERMCAIWQRILKVERVGINDNFFELGGHSLLATSLIAVLSSEMQVALPVRIIFECPTVSILAKYLELQLTDDSVTEDFEIITI